MRRPYYRMRGKPVTEDQAFDIIRRTDNFFQDIDEIERYRDYIHCINFDNWLIHKNHHPRGYGWIHADGTVGCNAITQKYPNIEEFIDEWICKLINFPYLDLVIAVTSWNEAPYRYWKDEDFRKEWEMKNHDKEFYNDVFTGIYVHD